MFKKSSDLRYIAGQFKDETGQFLLAVPVFNPKSEAHKLFGDSSNFEFSHSIKCFYSPSMSMQSIKKAVKAQGKETNTFAHITHSLKQDGVQFKTFNLKLSVFENWVSADGESKSGHPCGYEGVVKRVQEQSLPNHSVDLIREFTHFAMDSNNLVAWMESHDLEDFLIVHKVLGFLTEVQRSK